MSPPPAEFSSSSSLIFEVSFESSFGSSFGLLGVSVALGLLGSDSWSVCSDSVDAVIVRLEEDCTLE